MIVLATVLALQSLAPPPPPVSPRAKDATPFLAAAWNEPIEDERGELINPFVAPELTATATPEATPIPSGMDVTVSNYLGIDLNPDGEVQRIYNVLVPACEVGAPRCEMFDVIARTVTNWDFRPAKKAGKKVSTRVVIDLKMEMDFGGVDVEKVRVIPVEPTTLPPPAIEPIPSLDSVIRQRLAEGASADLPLGWVPMESLDEIPLPPNRGVDVPNRALSVAGDLLVHITEAGTVDQLLALEIQPRILWPFWQQAVKKWRFRPARSGNRPTASWVRVLLDRGRLKLTADSRQVSTFKKNLPVFPAAN